MPLPAILIGSLYSANASDFGIVVEENYILKPSDVIQERYQEPDLDKTVRIEADGSVTLPLISKIKVLNYSLESQELITQLYNRIRVDRRYQFYGFIFSKISSCSWFCQ